MRNPRVWKHHNELHDFFMENKQQKKRTAGCLKQAISQLKNRKKTCNGNQSAKPHLNNTAETSLSKPKKLKIHQTRTGKTQMKSVCFFFLRKM